MNGQHLQALPSEELKKRIGNQWKSTGILTESEGSFVEVRLISSALPFAGYLVHIFPETVFVFIEDKSYNHFAILWLILLLRVAYAFLVQICCILIVL